MEIDYTVTIKYRDDMAEDDPIMQEGDIEDAIMRKASDEKLEVSSVDVVRQ